PPAKVLHNRVRQSVPKLPQPRQSRVYRHSPLLSFPDFMAVPAIQHCRCRPRGKDGLQPACRDPKKKARRHG
ncbi:MAG: hypothetical protein J0H10_15525, partial [Alphaproteobacteria bacterium]|nr:hypothetical protein [Alphaproteobacteria bacterium]